MYINNCYLKCSAASPSTLQALPVLAFSSALKMSTGQKITDESQME